jgi:hypothetical protein
MIEFENLDPMFKDHVQRARKSGKPEFAMINGQVYEFLEKENKVYIYALNLIHVVKEKFNGNDQKIGIKKEQEDKKTLRGQA